MREIYERATEMATMSGDVERAVVLARAALAEAEKTADPATVAARWERLSRAQMDTEATGTQEARRAVELLADQPVTQLTARAYATLARATFWPDPDESAVALGKAIRTAELTGSVAIAADALVTRSLMIRRGLAAGDPAEQLDQALSLTEGRPEAGAVRVRALRFRAVQLFEDGQTAAALELTGDALRFAADAGLTWTPYGLDLQLARGWILDALGRWDEAIALALPSAFAEQPSARILATLAVALLGSRGDPEAETIAARLRGTDDPSVLMQLGLAEIRMWQARADPRRLLAAAAVIDHGDDFGGFSVEQLLMLGGQLGALADLADECRSTGADPAAHTVEVGRLRQRVRQVVAQHDHRVAVGRLGPYGDLLAEIAEAEAARAEGHDRAETWANNRAACRRNRSGL